MTEVEKLTHHIASEKLTSSMDEPLGYDIVGDVHGHAHKLEDLLRLLGYRLRHGVWQHPERHLVFVGDLIDRGPEQLRVLEIARTMRDAGYATVLAGNHEYNAVCWMTELPGKPGVYARDRLKRSHYEQHAEFLRQVGADSALHREWVGWMRTLPLWLDLPGFRVIHACWHAPSLKVLSEFVDGDAVLTAAGLEAAQRKGTAAYEAVEIVLKGLEVPLPSGVSFLDKGGHRRHEARINWWDEKLTTFRAAALCDEAIRHQLPDVALPPTALVNYDTAKPVFFGHYWLHTDQPTLACPRRACLDYSVAKEGKLVAYRWDGESDLEARKLVWV